MRANHDRPPRRPPSILLLTAALLSLAAGRAAAQCQTCSSSMLCTATSRGSYLCDGNGFACAMAFPCPLPFGGQRIGLSAAPAPGGRAVAVEIAFFEDGAFAAGPGRRARVARARAADFRLARVRAVVAEEAPAARLVEGRFLVAGGPFAAALATPFGDGLAIEARPGAGGVRVRLRALAHGRAAAPLSDEMLAGDDLAIVPAVIGGRAYRLAVRALALPLGPGLDAAERALQRAFYDELRASAPAPSLGLTVGALDE